MKHIPRKRFGQNFLTDNHVLEQIVEAINPQPDDHLVEIGPGLAALTGLLLPHLKHMDAVELDRDLVLRLQNRFAGQALTLHSADALSFDFGKLAPVLPAKLRIVGNLPYNISSPLLFHLASFAEQVQDQHFMLQKEVVERMVAEPGGSAFGRLSVMLQWRYRMELLFIVPPEAFDPPPKVESAIVRMIPLAQPDEVDAACFSKVVAQAFSQRRKTIKNSLSVLFDETALRSLGINPGLRPEALGVSDYVTLANALMARGHLQPRQPAGEEPAAEQQGYPD